MIGLIKILGKNMLKIINEIVNYLLMNKNMIYVNILKIINTIIEMMIYYK